MKKVLLIGFILSGLCACRSEDPNEIANVYYQKCRDLMIKEEWFFNHLQLDSFPHKTLEPRVQKQSLMKQMMNDPRVIYFCVAPIPNLGDGERGMQFWLKGKWREIKKSIPDDWNQNLKSQEEKAEPIEGYGDLYRHITINKMVGGPWRGHYYIRIMVWQKPEGPGNAYTPAIDLILLTPPLENK